MISPKDLILPALCGSLLANSIFFNGKLGSKIGSFRAVLESHAVGLVFILIIYILLKNKTNLFEIKKFKLNQKLALEILGAISFSFLLVYAANKAVNHLQAFLAIPMFLVSVVATTSICELLFYKKTVPLYAFITVSVSAIVIFYFRVYVNAPGILWSIFAAIGVYSSRNLQRKISSELTPFTCTLLIYITLGTAGLATILINVHESKNILLNQTDLYIGGVIGAAFQFLLAITLVKYGNLRTNTFIQISQIIFGLLTRLY